MRVYALLPTVFAGALGITATTAIAAQTPGVVRIAEPARAFGLNEPRAVIGITTSSNATNRDTLGVLVNSVRSGSPAEKAGIEEGNRIASINGVSLKLAAADVGDYDMANAMTRRLTRELDKLKPGDEVNLVVVADGHTKNVSVKTVAREDIQPALVRRADEDRATLGLTIMSTGTARDSLGPMVLGVDDKGPAAKAGIEEGSRIVSINGVELRNKDVGDEDIFARVSMPGRFERELNKAKPGDDVDLRLYFNGQYRSVKVKTVRASDLPRRGHSITIVGGGQPMSVMPAMPVMPVRPAMPVMPEMTLPNARALQGSVQRLMERMPMFGNRVSW